MIISFDNADSASDYGGKANQLIKLFREGFNVPFGVILDDTFYETFLDYNPELKSLIQQYQENPEHIAGETIKSAIMAAVFPENSKNMLQDIIELLNQKVYSSFAVRSSGNMEDGQTNSFAGQFDSYLNIRNLTDLLHAVQSCWASLFDHKVLAYCLNNGIAHSEFKLHVIIQGLIQSESAGVVFTANPLTGKDTEMVIEAVRGLGESLVQGSVMPDMYYADWYHSSIETRRSGEQDQLLVSSADLSGLEWHNNTYKEAVLNTEQIQELSQECLKIQVYYGQPMDIEWAYAQSHFYILQARPMTSIQFSTEYDWTNADLKDGGISSSITTPMMYSLYELIFEHTMPAYFKALHIYPKKAFKKWFTQWFGYSYWNMEAAKEGAKQIPGFIERNFDISLGIEPAYEGKGHVTGFTPASIIRGLRILMATNRSIRKREADCRQTIADIEAYFKALNSIDFDKLNTADTMDVFRQLIEDKYQLMEGRYFYTIYDNSNAATFCQETIDKLNKKGKNIQYLKLIAGLTDLSHLRPSYELWDMSRLIKSDTKACAYYLNTTIDKLVDDIRQDASYPFREEFRSFLNRHAHHSLRELDLLVPNWNENPAQALEMLRSFLKMEDEMSPAEHNKKQVKLFHDELSKITDKGLLKKINTHRNLLWWREEMRDYSSQFYARIRKVLLVTGKKLQEDKRIRELDDVFFLTYQQLLHLASIDPIHVINKNRIFYRSFRHFDKPNEIFKSKNQQSHKKPLQTKDVYTGIAGSGGIVQGRVILINSIYEADSIQDGDILVTKFTDPAWTPYFSRISGLVTETGGMLSHGAVVSREYGNPAVLAVKNACSTFKTGDMIELDGYNGTVKMMTKK